MCSNVLGWLSYHSVREKHLFLALWMRYIKLVLPSIATTYDKYLKLVHVTMNLWLYCADCSDIILTNLLLSSVAAIVVC